MFCTKCGANVGTNKFCTQCGAPVLPIAPPAAPERQANIPDDDKTVLLASNGVPPVNNMSPANEVPAEIPEQPAVEEVKESNVEPESEVSQESVETPVNGESQIKEEPAENVVEPEPEVSQESITPPAPPAPPVRNDYSAPVNPAPYFNQTGQYNPAPPETPVYVAPPAPPVRNDYSAPVNPAPPFNQTGQYNPVPPAPPAPPAYIPPEPKKEKKKGSAKLIVAILAVLAVIAGALAFIFFRPIPITSVEFETPATTIDIDSEYEVIYTVLPENNKEEGLAWSSSDEKVATVKDGKVTPVGEGECTIKATSEKGVSDKIIVTVVIEPKEIKMSQSSITLNMGDTMQLTATITPEKVTDGKITWETDNDKVATVDVKGSIATKGLGTCTITATASNGIKAECKVTVERPFAETLIIGDWNEESTIDRTTRQTVSLNQSLVVNGDYTAKVTLTNGTTVDFTWKFITIDGDGDFKYQFTNTNGGEFDVFVIQDTSNSAYGMLDFTMDDYLIFFEKDNSPQI